MITKKINQKRNDFITFLDMLPLTIASFFSIVFSLSISITLYGVVENYVFYFLCAFIILFLLFNEKTKVDTWKRFFESPKLKNLNFQMFFTLSISIFLSVTGIYFFTNNTYEIETESSLQQAEKANFIGLKYSNQIDSIKNLSVASLPQYQRTINDLEYWKNYRVNKITLDARMMDER